jgi:phage-related protein
VSFQVNEIVGRREGFVAVADFSLPDPYFYGGDIVTDRTIASSPHSFNLSNPGTVRTSKLAISATGPLSNLRLTQTATGIWVEALVTVPSGKVLAIDTDKATAVLDGTSVVQSIRHSGDVRWWLLEPGTNPITIESGTTGGQVSIVFAPVYL